MKNAILLFAALFYMTISFGQDLAKTILWKVTKPGNKNESYLFGTFHEVNPIFFDSLSGAVAKLQQSRVLFVEARFSENPSVNQQPRVWNAEKWNAVLTNGQKVIFNEFIKKSEDTSYYKLDPLLLSLTVARLYLMNFCEPGTASNELMDTHIENYAIKKNIRVYALDSNQGSMLKSTAETFGRVQDSLYSTYVIDYMKKMLDNDLTDCEIIKTYKSFDINYKLDTDLLAYAPDAPLLIKRNKVWIQVLDKALSSNNCFVAVGFKHLCYKQGLIQQLRALGYRVSPIPVRL
jgi:uncharacterized protein YbaP (TraB family)